MFLGHPGDFTQLLSAAPLGKEKRLRQKFQSLIQVENMFILQQVALEIILK